MCRVVQTILLLSASGAWGRPGVGEGSKPKCMGGDPCWPQKGDWEVLGKGLEGEIYFPFSAGWNKATKLHNGRLATEPGIAIIARSEADVVKVVSPVMILRYTGTSQCIS